MKKTLIASATGLSFSSYTNVSNWSTFYSYRHVPSDITLARNLTTEIINPKAKSADAQWQKEMKIKRRK